MPSPYNLTTEQVAARYALTKWGVRRMVRAGKLNAVNIGTDQRRILRYSEDDLRRFEKSRGTQAGRAA